MKRLLAVAGLGALLCIAGCAECLEGLFPEGDMLGLGCDGLCQEPNSCEADPIGCGEVPENNLDLMRMAEGIVHVTFEKAILIEVHGTPTSGAAQTASDIDHWAFIFVEDPTSPQTDTIVLEFADGDFGELQVIGQPWGGTIYERLPQEVTLDEALATVRAAGFGAPFEEVVLRKPLTWPFPDEAYYAFLIQGQYILVGAESNTLIED